MKELIMQVLTLFCMLCLVGCGSTNNEQTGAIDSREDNFADEYRNYGGEFLVLGLVNDTDLTENGVVYLNSITDDLNVQFANLTDKDSEYILMLFLDYKEIGFYLNGELTDKHIFQAKVGESLVFPINLDSAVELNSSHFLTVAILTSPNKHAKTIDLMSNSYGMVLSYELAPKNGNRTIEAESTFDEASEYLELHYQGLVLNSDFDTSKNAKVRFPEKEYVVKAGDAVKLAYRAGNYENAEDILIVVLVDWQQQSINDADYIHIRNSPGYISFGTLEFTAPLEAGEYEVTAFVADQPFNLKNSDSFHTHDTAYRFTLTVQK